MALRISKTRQSLGEVQPANLNLPSILKEDPLEVIRLLEQAYDQDPKNSPIFTELEERYRQAEQPDRVQRVLLTRLKATLDVEAINRLGVLLFNRGNRKQAIRCFELARRYGSSQARENLKALRGNKPNAKERVSFDPEIEAVLKALEPRLSACLIVKNEERFLRNCLESLRGIADEVIVVDTGSTDQTVKIAKRMGAKVHHFDWIGDFSAARNESIRHATGDWILIIDADEHLDPQTAASLRLAIADPGTDSYLLPLLNKLGHMDQVEALLPRLFRRREGVRFTGRIHEQVLPQLDQLGFRHQVAAARLIHEGYLPEVVSERDKHARNLALLEQQLHEEPGNIDYQFQLGKQLIMGVEVANGSMEDAERAAKLIEAVCGTLELMAEVPGSAADAFLNLAKAYQRLGRQLEVVRVCQRGLRLYPDFPDLRFMLGLGFIELGRYSEALTQFRKCRELEPRIFQAVSDPATRTWRSYWGEAIAYLRMGFFEDARPLLESAFKDCSAPPSDMIRDLAFLYAATGQHLLALGQYYGLPASALEAADWQHVAKAHFHLGQYEKTLEALEMAGPSTESWLECLAAESNLWLGRIEEARGGFERALILEPGSTGAMTGLGACHLISWELDKASVLVPRAHDYFQILVAHLESQVPLPARVAMDEIMGSWGVLFRHALAAGRLELPEAMIAMALREAGRHPKLARQLAGNLLAFDAAELALELLEKSLPVSTNDASHFYLLGQALEMSQQPEVAREAYRTCLSISDGHAAARERLEALVGSQGK